MFGLGKTAAEKWWDRQRKNIQENLAQSEFHKAANQLNPREISYLYINYGCTI